MNLWLVVETTKMLFGSAEYWQEFNDDNPVRVLLPPRWLQHHGGGSSAAAPPADGT